jgi:hypothetical protein
VRTSNKKKLLMVLIYCVGVCIFFEGVTRLVLSSDSFFEKIKGEDDASRRLMWIKKHHGQIKNTYAFDMYDPVRGWALRPNIRNMVVFGGKILNSNSKGIRGVEEHSYNKPSNKVRILVVGDSFIFGEDVSDNETLPHYLQQMLPHSEVLNFGVHGYGHDQMLLYLKEEGVKYNPDVVIVGVIYGDMKRNLMKFRDYAKPKFELVNKELKLTNVPVPLPESFLEKEFYRSKFYDLLIILYHKVMLHLGIEQKRAEEVTTAILDEMSKTIKDIGAVPVFAYLPYNREMENVEEKITEREKYFFHYCDGKGIYCVSIRPYFAAKIKKGVVFKTSGHWDAKGNLIAAEGIKEHLLGNVIRAPK